MFLQSLSLSFFLIVFYLKCTLAQNLVPNPSFEEYNQCPEFLGSVRSYNLHSDFGVLKDWRANPSDCTPDYFHPCGKKDFRVPKNLCGEMEAKEGKAYLGMIVRIGEVYLGDLRDLLYREHVQAKLLDSLKANHQYLVKMHLSTADFSNFVVANIGILLSKEPIIIQENGQYNPQVVAKEFIQAKKKWVIICDTFTAKGGEKYITIGNFDKYSNRKIKKITNSTEHFKKFNFNRAYYYFDEISVESIGIAEKTVELEAENDKEIFSEFGKLEKGKSVILKNIFFEFAKANLLPASFEELDKLLKIMQDYPAIVLEIAGHTDSIGTETDNQILSENRAKSVVNYLLKKGIDKKRLIHLGFGESKAIDNNETEEGRQNNRRVEFVIK